MPNGLHTTLLSNYYNMISNILHFFANVWSSKCRSSKLLPKCYKPYFNMISFQIPTTSLQDYCHIIKHVLPTYYNTTWSIIINIWSSKLLTNPANIRIQLLAHDWNIITKLLRIYDRRKLILWFFTCLVSWRLHSLHFS